MKKTVLITGGTTGIGKCSAELFGKRGWNVAVTSRNAKRGEEFVKELEAQGIDAMYLQVNVDNEQEVAKAIDDVVARFGKMDCIVNNAGIAKGIEEMADTQTDDFKAMLETNVLGVYYGMKYAIRHYLATGGGSIVNLASIAGLNGIAHASTYCATKHAVVGLTKGAAVEYSSRGIRVNAVAPAACKTDIVRYAIDGGVYDEKSMGAMNPINRMGLPEEIATAIYFLASDDASFITGAILSDDGGYNAK